MSVLMPKQFAGNMMNTTMSAVGSLISGLTTFFIAVSFACYILFLKEKLHVQSRKVFFAFLPKNKKQTIHQSLFLSHVSDICKLSYRSVPPNRDSWMYVCHYTRLFCGYLMHSLEFLIAFTAALIPVSGLSSGVR